MELNKQTMEFVLNLVKDDKTLAPKLAGLLKTIVDQPAPVVEDDKNFEDTIIFHMPDGSKLTCVYDAGLDSIQVSSGLFRDLIKQLSSRIEQTISLSELNEFNLRDIKSLELKIEAYKSEVKTLNKKIDDAKTSKETSSGTAEVVNEVHKYEEAFYDRVYDDVRKRLIEERLVNPGVRGY